MNPFNFWYIWLWNLYWLDKVFHVVPNSMVVVALMVLIVLARWHCKLETIIQGNWSIPARVQWLLHSFAWHYFESPWIRTCQLSWSIANCSVYSCLAQVCSRSCNLSRIEAIILAILSSTCFRISWSLQAI